MFIISHKKLFWDGQLQGYQFNKMKTSQWSGLPICPLAILSILAFAFESQWPRWLSGAPGTTASHNRIKRRASSFSTEEKVFPSHRQAHFPSVSLARSGLHTALLPLLLSTHLWQKRMELPRWEDPSRLGGIRVTLYFWFSEFNTKFRLVWQCNLT